MIRKTPFQAYMEKAQEAEENATMAADPEVIRAWRKIADGYLMLANISRSDAT